MAAVLEELSSELAGIASTAGASLVRVAGRRRVPASGVVWSADGVILTANHVVRRDEGIEIGLPDGSLATGSVAGRDPATDIAVLRSDADGLTAASWASLDDFAVGNLVLALGRPGKTVQATLGVISALGGVWRTHAGGQIDRYLQTDVVMYPGFSGGALVGVGGQVLGLNSSALMRGVSISIPGS
ncbi:MAG: S1C family serine protease, partial [Anaerolineales bacterium]